MAIVIDEVISEVDVPVKTATTTEKNPIEMESENVFNDDLATALKQAGQRKLRLTVA